MPGNYTAVLTVNGKKYEQALRLVMDPRVKTSSGDLKRQFDTSMQMYNEWLALSAISDDARKIRAQLTELRTKVTDATLKGHVDALAEKIQNVAGAGGGGFGGGGGGAGGGARVTAASVMTRARTLFGLIEEADVAPTTQIMSAVPDVLKDSQGVQQSWQAIKSTDIATLNKELRAAGLPPISGN
jgi:hypothetical protein